MRRCERTHQTVYPRLTPSQSSCPGRKTSFSDDQRQVPEWPILQPVLVKPVSAPVIGPGKKWGSDQPDPRQRLGDGNTVGEKWFPKGNLGSQNKGGMETQQARATGSQALCGMRARTRAKPRTTGTSGWPRGPWQVKMMNSRWLGSYVYLAHMSASLCGMPVFSPHASTSWSSN